MGRTVLLIEQYEGLRRMYERVLNENGFTVFSSPNIRRGLADARRVRPNAIAMDLGLPLAASLSAAASFRGDLDPIGGRLIGFTVWQDIPELAPARQLFHVLLEKPVAPMALLREIEGDGRQRRRWVAPAASPFSPLHVTASG